MSAIKPGDLVVVIYVEDSMYSPDCQPGDVFTILRPCDCFWSRHDSQVHWRMTNATVVDICALERILRRIDPDGREKVEWDWRKLVTKETA